MKKRSVKVMGHSTSITLEDGFWDALKDIAKDKDVSINQMVSTIDQTRSMDVGLSSALRLYILEYYRHHLDQARKD